MKHLFLAGIFFIFLSCNLGNFAGEYHAICSIEYSNLSLNTDEVLDSVIIIFPSLKERTQEIYSYDFTGTGFNNISVFVQYDNMHYVLALSLGDSTDLISRLSVTNFGIEGEVSKKFDSLSKKKVKLAVKVIQNELLPKFETTFPNNSFSCHCADSP